MVGIIKSFVISGVQKSSSPEAEIRVENRPYWSLKVAVLRTGCSKTTGHPFQVHSGIPRGIIGFFDFRYTAVYRHFV
jgi:hypothetical protein